MASGARPILLARVAARAVSGLAAAAVGGTNWHRGMADSAYDASMAASSQTAVRDVGYVMLQIVSPQGEKHPLKVRPSDDVATLRALCTQVSLPVVRMLNQGVRSRSERACVSRQLGVPAQRS